MNAFDNEAGNRSRPHDPFEHARNEMIATQLRKRGITDSRVLAAMGSVPREEFVPAELRGRAYEDAPLPIGEDQTISQPYIVAAMTAALRLNGSERVLEVGSGCGYQAAILASLAAEVFAVEWRPKLAQQAFDRLQRLHFNVRVECADGTLGSPQYAPFDAILVAAAAPAVPPPLLEQLSEGGRMVVPVGDIRNQELRLIQRVHGTFRTIMLESCRFVPLIGVHGWKESALDERP
jgi:protein-L-isoaspartate(D-aspartate) O-methyltransferase